MFQGRKGILVLIAALFIFAFAGLSYAAEIDGLTSGTPTDVYVNPGGLGQALIYNYYSARGQVTYFTVVNTDTVNGARVRLRFREAGDIAENGVCDPEVPLGSFEVLDFDICLSAGDIWTGHVMENSSTGGAMLCADDVDTLVFDNVTSDIFENVFPGCAQFKFGSNNPVSGITAENTLEGYFEILGEDKLVKDPLTCRQSCADVSTDVDACLKIIPDLDVAIGNSLFGNAAMIDQETGALYSYNATALADWTTTSQKASLTSGKPELKDGDEGLIGVNYVLTKEQLFSIYDLIGTQTVHIITLPTKLLTFQNIGCTNLLFKDLTVGISLWSPDEQLNTPSGCSGSPCVTQPSTSLPFEVNVLPMDFPGKTSDFIDSGVIINGGTGVAVPFDFGWVNINMNTVAGHFTPTVHNEGLTASFGWPSLGLTLLNIDNFASIGTFPMQYKANVKPSLTIIP